MKITKNISLLILAITALICSRTMFSLFNDPEGPNLLIVIGAALIIYALSWAISRFYPGRQETGPKGLVVRILIQVLVTGGLYLCLV